LTGVSADALEVDQDEGQRTPALSYRLSRARLQGESISPLIKLGQAATPRTPAAVARTKVTPTMSAIAMIVAVALGLVFRFPLPALVLLPFGGLAVVMARRWRWGAHVASTLFLSAFLAQATSIFITPFSWWMRFLFVLALAGSPLLLFVWQTKEL
jgi:hypothetical protein